LAASLQRERGSASGNPRIQLDLNLRSSYVEAAWKDLIRLQAF